MAATIGANMEEEEQRRQREEQERLEREAQAAREREAAEAAAQAKAADQAQKDQTRGFEQTVKEKTHGIEFDLVKAGEIQSDALTEEQKAHLNEKNRKGELGYGTSWGAINEIKVDYSTIKDTEQAVFFATMLETDKDKLTFFKEYAKHSKQNYDDVLAYADDRLGTKIFASPQSNAGKRNAMETALGNIGLFDINGDDIQIGTADFDTVVQSLNNIADEDEAKKAASYVESLTKIPGSPYYGMTFDKSTVEYRDSANLPGSTYKDEVDALSGLFYTGEEAAASNQEAYLAKYEELQEVYGADKYAFRQVEKALKRAYEKQTGYVAPDSAKVQEIIEQTKADRALAAAAEAEDAKRGFGKIVSDIWSGIFSKEKKEEEEEPAAADVSEPVEGEDYAVRDGYVASVSPSATSMPAPAESTEEAEAETPAVAEAQGPAYQPQEDTETAPMTYSQAMRAYQKGEDLPEDARALIEPSISNDDFRNYVVNKMTPEPQAIMQERAYGGTVLSDAQARERANTITSGRQLLGATLGGAVEALETGALPQDVSDAGYQLMADVMNDVSRYIRSGRIAVPAGENKYDYVIANVPHINEKAKQLADLQKNVNNVMATRAVEAAHDYDKKVEDAELRFMRGHATQEDLMLLSSRAGTETDLSADTTRAQFRHQLSYRSMWYEDDGSFWKGDSAAAQEGARLRETHADGQYGEYKRALMSKAQDVIDELTYIAADHGMTLGGWMEKVGLSTDDPSAIMDMAYNRMCAEGAALGNDSEAQEAINVLSGVETKGVGLLTAGAKGLGHGLADDAYHFMNAGYSMMDAATYDARRNEILNEYSGEYGVLAPSVRRNVLIAYANSGELSKEMSQELLEDIDRCENIFDIAIDVDPGLIESLYLGTMNELSKTVEELEGVRELLPESERKVWDALYGVGTNVPGMIRSAATTIGAAAVGVPLPAAKAAGLWMGYGATSFSRGTEKYEKAGMSKGAAMFMGALEAGAMMAVNLVGQDTATSFLSGKALMRDGIEEAYRSGKWFGVAKAIAAKAAPLVAEEALEEGQEQLAEAGVALAAPVVEAISNGEQMTLSKGMQMTWNEFKDVDVKELFEETVRAGLGGAAYGALFAFPRLAMDTGKGRVNANFQKQYPSIDIASQIVHGEIPASDENMGRFIDLMRQDLDKPEFRTLLDKKNDAAEQANSMAVAALLGEGKEFKDSALKLTKKADQYDQKAEAAEKAVEINRSQFYTARKAASEGNEGALHTMEGFRAAWGKAQTTATENRQAAEKTRADAAEQTRRWIHACRKLGNDMYGLTKTRAGNLLVSRAEEELLKEQEPAIAEAEANVEAMDAEAFIEERYSNASDEQKDHIREIWGVPVGTKKETAAEAATVAENAQVRAEDEQTVGTEQTEEDAATAPQTPSEAINVQPAQTVEAPTETAPQNAQPATQATAKPMQTQTSAERVEVNRKRQLQTATKFAGQVTRRFGVKTEIAPANDERLLTPDGKTYASALYNRKEDKIIISENATQGDVIRAKIVHELAHRTEGTEAYKEFSKAVLSAYYKSDKNIESARNARKSLYASKGVQLDDAGIDSELVAYATEKLIGGDQEMVDRIVADSPSVARRIMDAIKAVLDKLTGAKGKEIDQLRAVEQMFKNALDESTKKRTASYQQAVEQSNHPAAVQFSVEQLAEATGLDVRRNDDGVPYTLIDKNGNEVTDVTPDMIKKTPMGNLIDTAVKAGTVNKETAYAQLKMFADLTTLAAQYKDQAMIWEIAGSQLFSAIKSNSDTQYGTTVDFGTICAKTQAIVDVMSETMLKLGRGLSRDEVIKTYRETANVGYNVPCPVCYVFSRWMGVPSLLNNIAEYQDRFTAMSEQEVKDYVSSVEERYAKGSDKPEKEIGNAKIDLEKKLDAVTREMQKRLEKGLEMGELTDKARSLEAEYKDVEAYNWVTQALCQRGMRDENGQVVLDPEFEPTPKEILFDLRRTSEFSLYKKNWTYRSTRGAGMGKSILPYSGARIGDAVKGNKDRWSTEENPFLSGDAKGAARAVANARRRMAAQNLIGGQRFQSTSDYRPEWGIDYMMTFLEMQAIGAKGQLYTKVIEAVDMFATAGIETNLSIMGKGNGYHLDENGNPVLGDDDFSSVTGIDFREAREKTKMYDNVQMILVGLNDTHIRLALADDDITFVIPWHSSGNSEEILSELMGAVGEKLETGTDYTKTQSDKKVAKPNAQQKAAADLRMRILTGELGKSGLTDADRVVLDTNPYLADLHRRFYEDESATETYGVKLSSKQASQVFPYEYWDTSLTIEDADENGKRFREYCESIGLEPRFSQFANDPGYWKLLIDRRMYNRDGTYHHPKTIDVTGVSIDSVAQSVGEVKYGDASRTDQAVQATIDNIRASIPAENYTGDIQYSVDDIYNYTEKTYNERGWMQVNDIISPNEYATINRRYSDLRKGDHMDRTADGKYIFDVGWEFGINPVVVITNGGYVNPKYERVYRIYKNTESQIERYRYVIHGAEAGEEQANAALADAIEEGVVGRYDRRDFGTFAELKREAALERPRGSGRKSSRNSSGKQVPGGMLGGSGSDVNMFSIDEKQFSLPDDDFLRAEIDAWRSNPNYSVEDADTGKRQFANQTIQNNQYIPDYIKQAFLNDPAKSDYSRESNMRQLNAAWSRVNSEGYEAARDRLVNQETKFTTEDNADALILMRQALHDGDLDTMMAVATKYNTEGTDQAKALQIRRLMRTMTPTGFAQTVIQDVSRKIEDRDTKRPGEKRRRERESKKTKEDRNLGSLDDSSAAETLDRGGSLVIDNKFGAPLNDAKRALIKEFGLEKTTRPGDYYNWATTKQRMLEDILTTDDIWAKDSNGMDLVDRLVRMKHGDIVLTKADLQYITDQMAIFDRLADKNSREADLALARAHEAQGNINGATGRVKRRTWRYVSMLLSVPSAIRNVIGNTAQAMPNAIADGIAVELDRVISKVAGTDRTRAHLTAKERVEGWEAFRDEVFNTFRDYFVDKAITQYGEGRYNQSQIGRVYQHQSLETLRHLEGLLMSVGDRNFWKKKFFNSMAEQQRIAEMNGTAFDVEAAMETAEAEANYATFNEDGTVRSLMAGLTEHIPFLDYLMPFVGVPTNIIKRQIQFSPIGIVSTAVRHGWGAIVGEQFDQRAFVDGMARGLTGSAMMGIGAMLFKSGAIKLGTKEEDDDKSYGVRTAQGDQYGVYFTIGDKNYSISTFSPAASALVAGAFVVDAMGDNERWYEAFTNATLKNINEIFDASYMSSLADALNTSNGKTVVENLIPAIGSAMITQNIPAPLSHLASSLDPYVRDTKDKDTLTEIINTTMNKIPGARQLLPEKVDAAGRVVKNTKQGVAAFVDPFTTSYVVDDPALDEMIRLRDALTEAGESEPRAHMATDALSGRKNTLTQNKVTYTVTPEEKEAYRKRYGDLWRNGGMTYDKKGKRVPVQGVEELIASRAYQLMSDKEKAKAIKEIITAAKNGATYEIMNHK